MNKLLEAKILKVSYLKPLMESEINETNVTDEKEEILPRKNISLQIK